MRSFQKTILAIALTGLSFNAFSAEKKTDKKSVPTVQPGLYNLDTAHSKVGFEIPHLVISTVEGRFTSFEGEINLAEKLADSKVNVTVNIDSIDTANADRDKHLKSADFFDAAQFAKMTFKSKKITGSFNKFKIIGDLTIKNKTKEVILDGQFLGTANDAYGNTKAAFNATAKINRQDFGLTWSKLVEVGPVVGNEVTINLKVQAARAK